MAGAQQRWRAPPVVVLSLAMPRHDHRHGIATEETDGHRGRAERRQGLLLAVDEPVNLGPHVHHPAAIRADRSIDRDPGTDAELEPDGLAEIVSPGHRVW